MLTWPREAEVLFAWDVDAVTLVGRSHHATRMASKMTVGQGCDAGVIAQADVNTSGCLGDVVSK